MEALHRNTCNPAICWYTKVYNQQSLKRLHTTTAKKKYFQKILSLQSLVQYVNECFQSSKSKHTSVWSHSSCVCYDAAISLFVDTIDWCMLRSRYNQLCPWSASFLKNSQDVREALKLPINRAFCVQGFKLHAWRSVWLLCRSVDTQNWSCDWSRWQIHEFLTSVVFLKMLHWLNKGSRNYYHFNISWQSR